MNVDDEVLKKMVLDHESVKKYIDGKKVEKVVVVRNKLVSVVVR